MDASRSSTSRRFNPSISSALCSVPPSKTAVTSTYHYSNQRKITNEFSLKECWLRACSHAVHYWFYILCGWHFASEDTEILIVFYFTRSRCTHTYCLFTWLPLHFSHCMKILPIIVSIVFWQQLHNQALSWADRYPVVRIVRNLWWIWHKQKLEGVMNSPCLGFRKSIPRALHSPLYSILHYAGGQLRISSTRSQTPKPRKVTIP